jgi:hypothetical protein
MTVPAESAHRQAAGHVCARAARPPARAAAAALRPRTLVMLAAVCAAGLLGTACSSPGHPGALAGPGGGSPQSPAASPSHVAQYLPHSSPAATSAPAASPSPSVPAATPAPAPAQPAGQPLATGPGPCAASGLRVGIGPANGAAGSIYYPLQFTNVSGVTCTMYGYPGVSFTVREGGPAVGGPAVRNPTFGKELVTVAPGVTVHASLQVAIAQNYPASICDPVTAHWLQVFPPASYVPIYVSFTAQTCTGTIPSGSTLGIYVVRPGATGP